MKKIMPVLGAIFTLMSIVFTRYIVSKYGENSRIIIMAVAVGISIIGFIGIILSKKYLAALWVSLILIPLVVMTIGIYLDNIYIFYRGFIIIYFNTYNDKNNKNKRIN
ncbi:UDP-N-acetylmuramyl pentapeptide phosphotransferase/UDP-N-acetylglucosamine-1-phosphate transferase [Clostridium pascui]|uniref:hypothetical protein n=1 Tax=Clostridium pascui TaxID=46609 RepID=UPI0019568623|nr:hypothetical protein [Clostridium pascui]MBM7868547.1 UDP-N-acetylmuramyl pentapeptide phosphotransferase/UDP-N-acetylglucosamine-1-phosphate transferase [Clostridium pascui]